MNPAECRPRAPPFSLLSPPVRRDPDVLFLSVLPATTGRAFFAPANAV